MEEWKTIQEYPNYEFSNQNRVRNKTTNKFLTLGTDNCFQLCKNNKIKTFGLTTLKKHYFPEPIEYLEGEIFLIIDGFPNYEISNKGRVYNNNTSKFLNPRIGNNGYFMIILHKNNKKKNKLIHRLLAETFIPNPKNLPYVDHIDRNKLNNRLENLRWATPSENSINTISRNKYPDNIGKYTNKSGNECWKIHIKHKNYQFQKFYRTDQYSLEEVVRIRNEKYREGNIT